MITASSPEAGRYTCDFAPIAAFFPFGKGKKQVTAVFPAFGPLEISVGPVMI
jgi:hypothetical protein